MSKENLAKAMNMVECNMRRFPSPLFKKKGEEDKIRHIDRKREGWKEIEERAT